LKAESKLNLTKIGAGPNEKNSYGPAPVRNTLGV